MGGKQRRHRGKLKSGEAERSRDSETVRLLNELLQESPVDTAQLRKIAAVRGLVSNEMRSRVWPLLLGSDTTPVDLDAYDAYCQGKHRDSAVVECDVARSLWSYTNGWSEEEREVRRGALRRVLNGTVGRYPGDVFYYQGLHDVAAVLLFVAGEKAAFRMLCHLARCQLRDCTRPTLDAVLELLAFLMPILGKHDPELHAALKNSGIPPYFALSWFITWFSHTLADLSQIARLFDLFLSSHPLMPLYVGASAMRAARESLLTGDLDPAELHSSLTNLKVLGKLPADMLAQQAVHLYKQLPPTAILASRRMRCVSSTAPAAELRDGHWSVPDQPSTRTGVVPWAAMHRLTSLLQHAGRPKRAATITTVASLSGIAAMYLAVMFMQRIDIMNMYMPQ